jgi:hypothetical protein
MQGHSINFDNNSQVFGYRGQHVSTPLEASHNTLQSADLSPRCDSPSSMRKETLSVVTTPSADGGVVYTSGELQVGVSLRSPCSCGKKHLY